MATEFIAHGVVPDTIPAPPPIIARVEYSNANHVNLGNVLSVSTTQQVPNIYFPSTAGVYYTVLMIDPDALSRATHEFRHFCHWIMINVPGMNGEYLDLSRGYTVVPYMGPAPPPGSDLHRYIFLIYRQHAQLTNQDSIKTFGNKPDERKSFNPTTWLNQHFPHQTAANANTANQMMQQQTANYIELLAGNFFLAEVPGKGKNENQKPHDHEKEKSKSNDAAKEKDEH